MFQKLVFSPRFYREIKETLRQIECVTDHIHRRTWVKRMQELGHYRADFFRDNIIPILEKKSDLPPWERTAIKAICHKAAKNVS